MASTARNVSSRRAAWSVLDQAASSLTNFGLSLAILKSSTLGEFGAFTIAYLAYQLALGLNRALVNDPLVIRFSTSDRTGLNAAAGSATGTAVALGITGGVILSGISFFFETSVRQALIVTAVALPMLVLQDSIRFAFFARGTPKSAFWNDLIWGTLTALSLATAFVSGNNSFVVLLACWAAAGSIAALIAVVQLRQRPQIGQTRRWLRNHADLNRRFVAEYVFARGAGYTALLAVSALAGLAGLGAINGSRVLFGPINVLYAGIVAVAVPEGARLVERSPGRLAPAILRLSLLLVVSAFAWGGMLFFLPAAVGESLVNGSDWADLHILIVPTAVLVAAEGFVFAQRAGLRILADARRSLRAQLVSGPLVLIGAVAGALLSDALGAAWGFAIGMSFSVAIWAQMFAASNKVTGLREDAE